MGRPPRADEANGIDHMLNRGHRREPLFHKTEDFEAFERMRVEAIERSAHSDSSRSQAPAWERRVLKAPPRPSRQLSPPVGAYVDQAPLAGIAPGVEYRQ